MLYRFAATTPLRINDAEICQFDEVNAARREAVRLAHQLLRVAEIDPQSPVTIEVSDEDGEKLFAAVVTFIDLPEAETRH